MSKLEYIGRLNLTATLVVKTGLHIGAGKDAIEIGGIDNPVVKHPYSGDPYVPGSSLKGKARFLLEWAFNSIRHKDGAAFGFDDDDAKSATEGGQVILRLFGTAASRTAWTQGPTRLIVRDAALDANWRRLIVDDGRMLTEDKTEVSIDRIAGKALDGVGPRHTERVPAGARFNVEIGFRAWSLGDDGEQDWRCLAWFIQALGLIEQDALGGSGSRGYGQVRFEGLRLSGADGVARSLDNSFRAHRFNPEEPPAEILAVVKAAARGFARAA
jgi:CRISPR-associated protein Csm3